MCGTKQYLMLRTDIGSAGPSTGNPRVAQFSSFMATLGPAFLGRHAPFTLRAGCANRGP